MVGTADPEALNVSIAIQNILLLCQNSSLETTDGFPLILVMFQINNICVNLLEVKPENSKHPSLKNETLYWRHHRKVFALVCQKFFNGNVYETYNEYIFHMVMCFLFAWRNAAVHLTAHLNWNKEQLDTRNQQLQDSHGPSDAMVYLYRSLLTKVSAEGQNACRIDQFQTQMEQVEEFVLSNIQELVFLRLN